MKSGMLIAVLLYELIVIGGIGLWLAKQRTDRKHEEGDFALGGRGLPVSVTAITLALTVLGTAHILGVFEMSWFLGASAVWFSIAHVILLVVVCLTTGIWFRKMGLTTVPQVLRGFFGPGTELAVSAVMAGVLFGILTLEAQGLGIIMASMTGWTIREGAFVGGTMGVLYVVLAGMKEVGWINLVNGVVLYVGLILSVIFLALRLPGGNFETVATFYESEPHLLSIYGNADIMINFAIATTVAVVFSQGINQMLLQPAMSAKDEQTIRKALWIAAPVNGMFGVFAVVIGLSAKAIPEFNALGPKVAATAMLVEYLPTWLATLLLASFLAAILSTFAMVALAPATIFSVNIYKNLYNPAADEDQVTRVTRGAIVFLAVIAMAIAAYLPPILAAINWLFAWLAPVFWVVVFGFVWKRSANAAMVTLVSAWVVNSAWSFTSLHTALGLAPDFPNAYVTLAVTLVVGILCNATMSGRVGYFEEQRSA